MFDFSLFFDSHQWCPINRKRQKISSKVVCKVLMSEEWDGGKVHNHWTIKLLSDIGTLFLLTQAIYLHLIIEKANYLIWTEADCSIDKAREKANFELERKNESTRTSLSLMTLEELGHFMPFRLLSFIVGWNLLTHMGT